LEMAGVRSDSALVTTSSSFLGVEDVSGEVVAVVSTSVVVEDVVVVEESSVVVVVLTAVVEVVEIEPTTPSIDIYGV
jgi:hypothetical protein